MVLRGLYGKGARADVGCRLQGETHLNTVGAFEDHPACQPANLPANRNARPEACFLPSTHPPTLRAGTGKRGNINTEPSAWLDRPFSPYSSHSEYLSVCAQRGTSGASAPFGANCHRLQSNAAGTRELSPEAHTASCRTSHLHAATSCALGLQHLMFCPGKMVRRACRLLRFIYIDRHGQHRCISTYVLLTRRNICRSTLCRRLSHASRRGWPDMKIYSVDYRYSILATLRLRYSTALAQPLPCAGTNSFVTRILF